MHYATPKALIACLVALSFAACGDDGGGEDEGGDEAAGGFCGQAEEMTKQHGVGIPVYDGQLINEEWLAQFEAIEPTPEIADQWGLLARDYQAYDEAVAEIDFDELQDKMAGAELDPTNSSMPEDFAEAMAEVNDAMAIVATDEHVNASNEVSQYMLDECSIGGG